MIYLGKGNSNQTGVKGIQSIKDKRIQIAKKCIANNLIYPPNYSFIQDALTKYQAQTSYSINNVILKKIEQSLQLVR